MPLSLFCAANASSPYLPSTPGGQPPMTPSSAYVPGTPGGQPMTPGSGALDMMSPLGGVSPAPRNNLCLFLMTKNLIYVAASLNEKHFSLLSQ